MIQKNHIVIIDIFFQIYCYSFRKNSNSKNPIPIKKKYSKVFYLMRFKKRLKQNGKTKSMKDTPSRPF